MYESTLQKISISQALSSPADSIFIGQAPGLDLVVACGQELFCEKKVSLHPWTPFKGNLSIPTESTSKEKYISQVRQIQESLARRGGGKTVLCRQICGTHKGFAPYEVTRHLALNYPKDFAFCFITPSTRGWIGSSPELLLTSEDSLRYNTCALAGTMSAETTELWSDKNIYEHNLVVEEIYSTLERYSSSRANKALLGKSECYDRIFGSIKHLAVDFSLEFPTVDSSRVKEIISCLHPTPAIAGYPRKEALEDIKAVEDVPRGMYGGYMLIRRETQICAYVVLRCAQFDEQKFAVYSGSGITLDSDPISEWEETEAKAQRILSILTSL